MRRIRPGLRMSILVVLCVTGLTAAAYSATRAGDGPLVFANSCSDCHGARLQGGLAPALAGAGFEAAWRDTAALLSFVSQEMPLDRPGSLSQEQYVSVVAHLLQQNGVSLDQQPVGAGQAGQ